MIVGTAITVLLSKARFIASISRGGYQNVCAYASSQLMINPATVSVKSVLMRFIAMQLFGAILSFTACAGIMMISGFSPEED
ncbi:MAG: hypothetical protein ACW98U_02680 [Candidatus Thorarchaeota archaeon]|jgi:hypothetical protein